MARKQKQGGKKGSRKIGRNKTKCEQYRLHRWRRNKVKRLMRRLLAHPDCRNSRAKLRELESA